MSADQRFSADATVFYLLTLLPLMLFFQAPSSLFRPPSAYFSLFFACAMSIPPSTRPPHILLDIDTLRGATRYCYAMFLQARGAATRGDSRPRSTIHQHDPPDFPPAHQAAAALTPRRKRISFCYGRLCQQMLFRAMRDAIRGGGAVRYAKRQIIDAVRRGDGDAGDAKMLCVAGQC
jgi:hypothetical protein